MRVLRRFKDLVRNHIEGSSRLTRMQVVALALMALTVVLLGVTSYIRSRPRKVVWQEEHSSASNTGDATKEMYTVHVAGAVLRPGVYDLRKGERVQGAIEAAGGPSPDADLNGLNLARKVKDGEQILVPFGVAGDAAAQESAGVRSSGTQAGYPLNINQASEEELKGLPGIGPKLAERIIEYRRENGPFSDVKQLTEVPGIGQKKLEDLKGLVTTG